MERIWRTRDVGDKLLEKQTTHHEISINLRGYPSQCSDTIYTDIADNAYRGYLSVLMFFPNVISQF